MMASALMAWVAWQILAGAPGDGDPFAFFHPSATISPSYLRQLDQGVPHQDPRGRRPGNRRAGRRSCRTGPVGGTGDRVDSSGRSTRDGRVIRMILVRPRVSEPGARPPLRVRFLPRARPARARASQSFSGDTGRPERQGSTRRFRRHRAGTEATAAWVRSAAPSHDRAARRRDGRRRTPPHAARLTESGDVWGVSNGQRWHAGPT
jgi:hypothetical protein